MGRPWDLLLTDLHHRFFPGKDDEARKNDWFALLGKYQGDLTKKALQVGVPSFMGSKYGPNFTSLDLHDQRPCIDIRQDLADTGLLPDTFDFITCPAVLEHVKDPFACAREMFRIAKSGADVWVELPFVQPFHPVKNWKPEMGYLIENFGNSKADEDHGGDYWRFTPQGAVQLMKGFTPVQIYLVSDGGVVLWCKKP